jgi:hypothetical protein
MNIPISRSAAHRRFSTARLTILPDSEEGRGATSADETHSAMDRPKSLGRSNLAQIPGRTKLSAFEPTAVFMSQRVCYEPHIEPGS